MMKWYRRCYELGLSIGMGVVLLGGFISKVWHYDMEVAIAMDTFRFNTKEAWVLVGCVAVVELVLGIMVILPQHRMGMALIVGFVATGYLMVHVLLAYWAPGKTCGCIIVGTALMPNMESMWMCVGLIMMAWGLRVRS